MKTGLAVTLTALVLATACSGNRTEAPAQAEQTASPVEAGAAAPAAPVETPPPTTAAVPPTAEIATTTTATTTSTPVTNDPPPVEVIERAAEPPPPPAPPAQKPADPLELLRESEAKRADYQQKLAAAEATVVEANAAIGQWQNTILAFKNPFRPRPALAAADAQAIEGKDGVSRVQWAEGKLAEATTARDTAQKALDDLKASPPY